MRLGPGCEKNKHQHSQENAEHNVKNDRFALIASEASFRADFVAEFQKFLNHRGIVVNFPLGALAHLGLARAYALQGDTAEVLVRQPIETLGYD